MDSVEPHGLSALADMRGLYAIIDVTTLAARDLPVVDFARAVIAARPAAVQLRAKESAPHEMLEWLRALVPICKAAETPLFANDRVDLAKLAGCDGVHVGQTDLPVSAIRRIAPELRVGVSTHDFEQAERAIASTPDYVAFGPVYPTRSKANPDPVVGAAALAKVVRRSPMPVVAIGGIDIERAREVGQVCPVAAMIGALIPDGLNPGDWAWVTERAREIHETLVRAWETGGGISG